MDLFSKNFKYLKKVHGHSREFLAKELKLTPTSISRYLSGSSSISPKSRKRIAALYNIDVITMASKDLSIDEKENDSNETQDLETIIKVLKIENEGLRKQVDLLMEIIENKKE